jgi:hypothetical protein
MTLPYSEGTVFLVPLRTGGYGRGVVARSRAEGKVLYGYFFGPRLPSADIADFRDINPDKAILRLRFGDLGLINGEWPIRGELSGWSRSQWPMSDFVRRDPLGRKAPVRVRYSDVDPNRIESESSIHDDAALPTDSLSGYGAVEIKLTKLLDA